MKRPNIRYGEAKMAFDALALKHRGNAFIVLPQVANATGWAAGRWLDAVVVSLWPSRGLWLHGYEIKISRGDWQRERTNAAKSAAHYENLDYFSLLVTQESIVQPGELPETWGLDVCDLATQKMRTVTPAPRIKPADQPMDRGFVMALMRCFDKECVSGDLEDRLKAAQENGYRSGKRDGIDEQRDRHSQREQNAEFFETFQATHGLTHWELQRDLAIRLGLMVKAGHESAKYTGGTLHELHARLLSAARAVEHLAALQAGTVLPASSLGGSDVIR